MAIIREKDSEGKGLIVDDDTGDYLRHYWHYQDPVHHYWICAPDGSRLIGAEVEEDVVDLSGNGMVVLNRGSLIRLWTFAGEAWTDIVDKGNAAVLRFLDFLEVQLRTKFNVDEARVEIDCDRFGDWPSRSPGFIIPPSD